MFASILALLVVCCFIHNKVESFSLISSHGRSRSNHVAYTSVQKALRMSSTNCNDMLELDINMPPSNSGLQAQIKLKPILDMPSELIQVRYKIPFGLDVSPQNGMAVCTKDGNGGEKVGDVLRLTSQWTMGLPRGNGILSTAASFSGAIGWKCSLFDVMKANRWDDVVEALTSNTPQRTDEVVLVFERPLQKEE